MHTLSKPVTGVFLDLGWTLLTPTSGDWMFSPFARRYFSREALEALPRERVQAAMAQGDAYLSAHHRMETMEEEYVQFLHYYTMLSQALPELGLDNAALEAVARDKVYNLENYGLFPDTLEALEALRGPYAIGVISDTWPSIVPVLEHFGLLPYFDTLTFSYQLGVYKPHPALYRDALEKMGLPAEETVFVDDGVGNLRGAQAAGIQPVLITAKPGVASCPPGMAQVSRISQLPGLLEQANH